VEEVGKTLERLRALAIILTEMEKTWKEIERLLDAKVDLHFLEGPPSVQFSFEKKNLEALRQLPKWLACVLECGELLMKGVRVKAGCVEVWGKACERGVAARVCLDEPATLFDILILSLMSEKEWDEILEAAARRCDELREALEKLKAILAHLRLLL